MNSNQLCTLDDLLFTLIMADGLPEPVRELHFHKPRKWRFDLAYPDLKIAIECEGGTWSGGRHSRGKGFEDDCYKYNQAELDGWKVFRFTSAMILNASAINTVKEALCK
jgi:hypothetical protein